LYVLEKTDVSESETGGSGISRGSDDLDEIAIAKPEDWRTPQRRLNLVMLFIQKFNAKL
jgi:hypothetical protein